RLGDVGMRGHRPAVDSGIGAPGGVDHRLLAGDGGDRLLDRLLDAGAMRLPLPAHEGAPVELDGQAETGHVRDGPARWVPAGMAKPRSSSPALIAALPARWTRVGRIAPLMHS